MAKEDPQMKIRLPIELKSKIQELANTNNRSMNAEIVFILEKYLQSRNDPILEYKHYTKSIPLQVNMMELSSKSVQNFNKIFGDTYFMKNMAKLVQDYTDFIKNTSKKGAKDENNE